MTNLKLVVLAVVAVLALEASGKKNKEFYNLKLKKDYL